MDRFWRAGGNESNVADGMFTTTTTELPAPDRATLALTTNGPILGLPDGATSEEEAQATERLSTWWSAQFTSAGYAAGVVLPWPTDVTDLRR